MLGNVGGSALGSVVGGVLAQQFGITGAVLVRVLRVGGAARAHLAVAGGDRPYAGRGRGAELTRTTGLCDNRDTMAEELSPSEVARRLGTSTRSVQRWIAAGRLPARRVGGRWRVAFDAIGAFGSHPSDTDEAARRTPIRTLFIANRGEIAARIRLTCERLGIHAVVPATDGPEAIDLLDPARGRRRCPRRRCRRPPPGFRIPRRERRLRAGRARCRHPLGRPAPERDPGDGRQGRGPSPGREPRRPGPGRLRRRRPVGRGARQGRQADRLTRCSSSRPPAVAARACAPSATRTASRPT